MVHVLPINYNNEHYKPNNFINGNEYQQHSTPPPPPPLQPHQQQMPIPMPVPMINHLMPPHHPHHQPPNFFHAPPPPPHQPMYPVDQSNGQYMDYGQAGGYHPSMGFMQQSKIYIQTNTYKKTHRLLNSELLLGYYSLCSYTSKALCFKHQRTFSFARTLPTYYGRTIEYA